MHRSGTSLATRVLNLLGLELGPEEAMMAATEDNPRGYWELEAVSDLDDELIGHLGGRWHRLPGFEDDWQHDDGLEEFRQRARAILRELLPDVERAAVKDPRLSVLLPFWRTVATVEHSVLVLRDPAEVVDSVRRRDGFEAEKSAALWIDHVTGAWVHDPDRHLVRYDELLQRPVAVAERLADALELPSPSGALADEIAATADPSLSRARGREGQEAGPAQAAARSLYRLLVDADTPASTLDGELARAWRDRNHIRRLEEDLRERDEQLRRARGQAQQAERRLQEAQAAARRQRNELQYAERRAERWEDEYRRLHNRRSVRAALALAETARPVVRGLRRLRGAPVDPRRAGDSDGGPVEHEPASEAEAEQLAARLRETAPGSDRTEGPLVSLLVLNRDGEEHLRRLLPGLRATTYRSFELVVVDNDSGDGSVQLLASADIGAPVTVLENDENVSFSAGNNQAAEAAEGDYLLLLNNDVRPATDGWLGRMVDTIEDTGAAAVGARLVYPRRPELEQAGDTVHPDLTLQHRGVHLASGSDGLPRGRNLGAGEDPLSAEAEAVVDRPAVTAACMLVRRQAFDDVGGLTPDYRYGTEDVDLCLKLRAADRRIVYDGQAVCWHHEFGTQNERGSDTKRRNRRHNREVFAGRWGPRVFRQVLLDKLVGAQEWSLDPLHVAITVTRDDPEAGFGDYYTAHELGDALLDLGYQVSYAERYDDRWYELDGSVDVLVVLLDAYELPRAPRATVTVAWVRNWTERWMDRPWFEDYDLVLASSGRSKQLVEEWTSKTAHLFPLATNPERFSPPAADAGGGPAATHDAVFAGNHWDRERAITDALRGLPDDLDVVVHGFGWDDVEGMERFDHGPVDYTRLPAVYRDARVVIDDAAGHTQPYNAVNSRVFDALAAGAVVATNNPEGAAELFDDEFPAWSDADSLAAVLTAVRDDPDGAARRAARYRQTVLAEHTYERRAHQLRDLLTQWCRATRISIAIGVPDREQQHRWGDTHFARDLQDELEAAGHPTRVLILPEWDQAHAARDDAVIHLFGLSEYSPRPGQATLLWNISHPELVTPGLVDRYDRAYVASASFAAELDEQTAVPVAPLLQATDPDRFRPEPAGAPHHELLFVGNSRKTRRRIIDDLTRGGPGALQHELAIYGADWTPDLVDPDHVVADHVDNERLGSYYAAADVVLNDHWDDMREHGFLSNRLFDALAAGAFVVSDHVDGLEEVFEDTVVTYEQPEELHRLIDHYLEHPGERERLAERGRELVLERHTFADRAAVLADAVGALSAERPATILDAGAPVAG